MDREAEGPSGVGRLNRRGFIHGALAMAVSGHLLGQAKQEVSMTDDTVFELRQYTLFGGRRDTLISLFEKQFIDPQNALGSHVIGSFRDLDDPDRFVWIRGFRNMEARGIALQAFYGGPVWAQYKTSANSTMADSDNVLLMRPALAGTQFVVPKREKTQGVYGVTIYDLASTPAAQFSSFFAAEMIPRIQDLGVQPIAQLTTEEAPNNYPRLPIREHDRVFLWIARWQNIAQLDSFIRRSQAWTGWRDHAPESVFPALARKPERLRLAPTQLSGLG